MVNRKANMSKKSNNRGRNPKMTRNTVKSLVLAKSAPLRQVRSNDERRMYKNILVDPCNAPLPRSPYELGQGATIARGVQLFANTQIYGVYFFHPLLGQYSYETATDIVGSLTPYGTTFGAGRAIAGCHSVSFIAQESSRAGTLSCGVVPGQTVWRYLGAAYGGQGATLKPSEAAAHLTSMERTPVDRCEINWFPSNGDEDMLPFVSPNTALNTNLVEATFAKVNFTMVVLLLGSAGGAYQHKFVSVVEQNDPTVASSSTWTVSASTKPSFSWKEVVEELAAVDPGWFIGTFKKIGVLVGGAVSSYATMGLPGALGYLTQGIAGMLRPRANIRAS